MGKYKHLFFDLDHTLWDFETNAKETLNDLYLLHEVQAKGVANFDDFFARYSFHNHNLWAKYTKGLIKQDELRWKRMWLTLLDYKLADEALSRTLAVQFLELLPTKKNLFAHTHEILTYLTNKGYILHLVTNGFETVQYNKLRHSNLTHFFVEVITSEVSNSIKPNKEIFDFALLKAKANVAESIMIGDNLEADIQGGINAGMDTIFVNHLEIEPTIKATYEIRSLKELEEIL